MVHRPISPTLHARRVAVLGLEPRLYVDNGAAFRSTHLAMVCAKLGVALIHA